MGHTSRFLARALLVLSAFTSAAAAQRQGQIEATPVIGVYLPAATLMEIVDPGSGVGVKLEQQSALALGGRIGYWLTSRVALEGAVTYIPGDIKLTILGTSTPPPTQVEGSQVLDVSARVRYRWPAGRVVVHLLGGVGMVSRFGNLWDLFAQSGIRLTGRQDAAAVLAAGVAAPICSGLDVRVELEDYLHQAKFTVRDGANPPEDTESRLQHDFRLSMGLAIPLGRP